MSGYNGRTGPNVSEYIANLNAIPPAQEASNQENFNLEEDLAMFTNTQFFDFDLGQDADLQAPPTNYEGQHSAGNGNENNLDFLHGEFSFPDFEAFTQQHNVYEGLPHGAPAAPHPTSSLYGSTTPVTSPTTAINSNSASSTHKSSSKAGEKRKADATGTPDFEEASRLAAEEDKRRRNTAASARFRIKKKQREQALERSAKEMSDKVAALEGRINQLETENKWLKSLITEKNESKEDIAALWKKYTQESGDRIKAERKDGVGTSSAASTASTSATSSA
ncbi:hypothetical protein F5884DRAFT_82258 [Xylogone sp. PMI_703]|nr:hypothetical protein F5884DRAFT_82258 [Xylogone sp. PMI_703]